MKTGRLFPWYDGYWLDHFVRAKAFIRTHEPDALPAFERALEPLRTPLSFRECEIKAAVDPATLAAMRDVIRTLKPNQLELHEIKTFGRWVVHDHPIMNELQDRMTALAEAASGEALEPSYNFLSMYSKLGRCPMHMDAPWAKWTLDVCVEQSDPWPIHFSQVQPWPEDDVFPVSGWEENIRNDSRNVFTPRLMEPGDAVLFSGSSQWHYRDPIPNPHAKSRCHLVFFHFIPRGMRRIMDPASWEACFKLPGLSSALGNPASEDPGQR